MTVVELMVSLDPPNMSERFAAASAELDPLMIRLVHNTSEVLLHHLEEEAPVYKGYPNKGIVPGELREGLGFTQADMFAVFTSEAQYTWIVINGARPHPIFGYGSPLHFFWERTGKWETFWSVNHPGSKPNDFRAPALAATLPEAERLLEATADEWLASSF